MELNDLKRNWNLKKGIGKKELELDQKELERNWSGIGAELERNWSGIGAELERNWSGIGAELERNWSGIGAELELNERN